MFVNSTDQGALTAGSPRTCVVEAASAFDLRNDLSLSTNQDVTNLYGVPSRPYNQVSLTKIAHGPLQSILRRLLPVEPRSRRRSAKRIAQPRLGRERQNSSHHTL